MSATTTISAADAARRAARPQDVADRRPAGDIDLGRMLLVGRTISADLRGIITDATLERTIDGASTLALTVHDRERRLLRSGVLHRGAVLSVDGLRFVLARPEKQGHTFALTFEDEHIWSLRQRTDQRKARRSSTMTRARFLAETAATLRRPAIRVWAPERDVVQEIARSDAAGSTGTAQPYEFSIGQAPSTSAAGAEATQVAPAPTQAEAESQEDWWSGMRRLADEVQWRLFVVAGVLHYGSDEAILAQSTRWQIAEGTDGVEEIDWTLDEGLRADEAAVRCLAERWAAPPGSVVRIVGQGPADGLWIVASIRRSLSSVQTEVGLVRPREPLPEPANAQAAAAATGAYSGTAPESIQRAYARAAEIDALRQPYLWGGYGPSRFDCSGGVSAVGNAGGIISGRMVTSGLVSWGAPGVGQHFTVWVRETGDPRRSHTFCEFHGFPHAVWEAGGTRGALTGWRPGGRSKDGFVPRHYPGT